MSYWSIFVRDNSFIARHGLKKLPRNFKRMVYVSSIFGLLMDNDHPDRRLIQKLNEIIELARDTKACEFPIYIRNAIWENLDKGSFTINDKQSIALTEILRSDLTTDACNAIGLQLASKVPSWLSYGSPAIMANDVIQLIKQLRNIIKTAPSMAPA